jgi:hypothetical protein
VWTRSYSERDCAGEIPFLAIDHRRDFCGDIEPKQLQDLEKHQLRRPIMPINTPTARPATKRRPSPMNSKAWPVAIPSVRWPARSAKSMIEQRVEEITDYAKQVTQTAAVIAALSAVAGVLVAMAVGVAGRGEAGPCPHPATRDDARDAGAIARPSAGRALTPERIAAFTVARDKPDYHVHNHPQTETRPGNKIPAE